MLVRVCLCSMSLDGGKSINLYTAVDAAVTAAPELVCMFDHVCMWTCVCYLCVWKTGFLFRRVNSLMRIELQLQVPLGS